MLAYEPKLSIINHAQQNSKMFMSKCVTSHLTYRSYPIGNI